MKTITLISHYNKFTLNLRIKYTAYEKLLNSDDPWEDIAYDLDRYHYGYQPQILSKYQCNKINHFFAKDNIEHFDNVIL